MVEGDDATADANVDADSVFNVDNDVTAVMTGEREDECEEVEKDAVAGDAGCSIVLEDEYEEGKEGTFILALGP